jgi:hypothetical protein
MEGMANHPSGASWLGMATVVGNGDCGWEWRLWLGMATVVGNGDCGWECRLWLGMATVVIGLARAGMLGPVDWVEGGNGHSLTESVGRPKGRGGNR